MAEDQSDAESFNDEVVSTERFIEEVKIQPAIWDSNTPEYSNRMEKVKAWEKVCCKVIPNFSNLNSKEKIKKVRRVQKRWKGLRSCYNREKNRKKDQKRGSAATCRKEYQYFSRLSFLASVSDIRLKTNPPENVTNMSPKADTTQTQKNHQSSSNQTIEIDFPKKISGKFENKQEITNEHDLNFLHSLLPHFKKVSDEFKLDLQSEILLTLKKYINLSRPDNNLHQYSQQFGYFSNSPTTSTHALNAVASPANTDVSHDSDSVEIKFSDLN